MALLSLLTTQLILSVVYLLGGTGGMATLLGWLAGAAVSYWLSRRAWDRRGRPDLLRETVPFWIIAAGTAVVLTAAGHLAGEFSVDHHLARIDATVVVSGTVLIANMLTFITRFFIFHYILFAEPARRRAAPVGPVTNESLEPVVVAARSGGQHRRP